MTDSRRLAYLEAIGIESWLRRPAAAQPSRLRLGPGSGSVLLLCSEPEQTSTMLASDINRYLGSGVAWGWPCADETVSNDESADLPDFTLEQAIKERLFTRVVFFGAHLRKLLGVKSVSAVMGSAEVLDAADFDHLASQGSARRDLWLKLSQSGSAPATGEAARS